MQKQSSLKFRIKIKKARSRDIESVYKIENEQFLHSWGKRTFYGQISNPISSFYLSILPDSKEVVGYIIFWLLGETIEIHKIAIKEELKRKGIGTLMINFAQKIGIKKGVKEIYLEVRESNKTAAHFYDQLGFKKMNKRKDYYRNPPEDAIIYAKSL